MTPTVEQIEEVLNILESSESLNGYEVDAYNILVDDTEGKFAAGPERDALVALAVKILREKVRSRQTR